MIAAAAGGFIIVLVFSLIIFQMFSQKRKANALLAEQNDEIYHQKGEIEASINYAKRIQQAVMPIDLQEGDRIREEIMTQMVEFASPGITTEDLQSEEYQKFKKCLDIKLKTRYYWT